jgi:ureidoacrylate peracid hydrolase
MNSNFEFLASRMLNCLLCIIALLFLFGCKNHQKESTVINNIVEKEANQNSNKLIHVLAKPDSISIDVEKTAIIVVDMENDFGSKNGMFDRAGIDISMIQKTVEPSRNVLAAARKEAIKIIYLKMGYMPNLSDLGSEGAPNRVRHLQVMHVGDTMHAPDGRESRILIRDSWGTDMIPQLQPQADDIILYKTRFSGFYQTALDSILKKLNKKYLIVIGCTTSICVESTVRDAMFRDYLSVVLEDCTSEPIGYGLPRSNHEASLLSIQALLGWVSNSVEFIKAVSQQPIKKLQDLQ